MAVRAKWSADYTKGVGVPLDGAESLEAGRDIVPAQRSLVERRLHIGMYLEHHRELVRQGNDRRAPGLASKALVPDRVRGTAADAAILGRCLLDRGLTTGAGADLERSDLPETVSDPQSVLQTIRSLPRPFSPDALLIMRAACTVSSIRRAYPHCWTGERITGGKNISAINARSGLVKKLLLSSGASRCARAASMACEA
jgi:hypothetical protein